MTTMDSRARRAAFRELHRRGCFTLPNPWDAGSAVRFAAAGFKALASTSAGAAMAHGRVDGELSVDEVLVHLRSLCAATQLPVNADFENGFGESLDDLGANVTRCVQTGVAGLSIEDRDASGLIPVEAAVERMKIARAAIDATQEDVVLVGRCEAYLMQPLDLPEVIVRLKAYRMAGADCLYAPGLRHLETIAELVQAVDAPVNANLSGTSLSVADMAAVGVRRVSVGAALADATYQVIEGFANHLRTTGRLPDLAVQPELGFEKP